MFPGSMLTSMWCLRGCYSKMAPGTVKRAICFKDALASHRRKYAPEEGVKVPLRQKSILFFRACFLIEYLFMLSSNYICQKNTNTKPSILKIFSSKSHLKGVHHYENSFQMSMQFSSGLIGCDVKGFTFIYNWLLF